MEIACGHCGEIQEVPVTPKQIKLWQGGQLIQNAMPNLSADQRELFLSGMCGKCWDRLFPPEE